MSDVDAHVSRFDRVRTAVAAMVAPTDPARGPRTAVVIGRLLAIAFLTCFCTGLFSHFLQDPLDWMRFPTRPIWIYQLSQGLHVASGLASVPLLLAKLWTVYPRLFTWPPIRSLTHLVERSLIGILVAASLLEVTIGVMNIYHWYAWPFSFRDTHYALAWIIVGGLVVHIAFQLPMIRAHWSAPSPAQTPAQTPAHSQAQARDSIPPGAVHIDRRIFVSSVLTATGALVALTAGQSTKLLSPLNLFGPRIYGAGPQGLPVNRTAAAANVLKSAVDPGWRLEVSSHGASHRFSLEELRGMRQTSARIPIACVEGWSTSAHWRGVRMRELLDACQISPTSRLAISSLQTRGGYASSEMGPDFTADDFTLIALELNGEVLDLDHGYPARIIAPGRPGVLQTKWITRIEVIA